MGTPSVHSREPFETARSVIPTGQLVVLREEEFDGDLAGAIAELRSHPETRNSRILVVAPDREGDAARTSDELPVPKLPITAGQLGRLLEVDGLRDSGQRLLPLLGCLDRFFDETEAALEELGESVENHTRARVLNKLRTLKEIVDWSREVGRDLRTESEALAGGFRAVDTLELVTEAAGQAETFFPGVRIQIVPDGCQQSCRGRAADLTEAFFSAFVLSAHRIGGVGAMTVERSVVDGFMSHRIVAHGTPQPIELADVVARFRGLIGACGGRVHPDSHGPHGASLAIDLPIAE